MPKIKYTAKKGLVTSAGSGIEFESAPSYIPHEIQSASGTLMPGLTTINATGSGHYTQLIAFPTATLHAGSTFTVKIQTSSFGRGLAVGGLLLTASNAGDGHATICIPSGSHLTHPGATLSELSNSMGSQFEFIADEGQQTPADAHFIAGQSAYFLCDGMNYIYLGGSGSFNIKRNGAGETSRPG